MELLAWAIIYTPKTQDEAGTPDSTVVTVHRVPAHRKMRTDTGEMIDGILISHNTNRVVDSNIVIEFVRSSLRFRIVRITSPKYVISVISSTQIPELAGLSTETPYPTLSQKSSHPIPP